MRVQGVKQPGKQTFTPPPNYRHYRDEARDAGGTDRENGTSFDRMAGAIWRPVMAASFPLFLLNQISKFVTFVRLLPRFLLF